MLERNFGLFFFLKKPSPYRRGPWLLFMRIVVDGVRCEVSLKRRWEPDDWLPTPACRAIGNSAAAQEINTYIDVMKVKVYEARTSLIMKGQHITAQNLKDIATGALQRQRMFLVIFDKHINTVEKLVGKEYSKDTWQRYQRVFRYTRDFIRWKYHQSDLNIYSLDLAFIKEFYVWLRGDKNIAHNTCIKYIFLMKSVVLMCRDNGWLSNDPFARFDMSLKDVETVFLTTQELEAIASKDIQSERLSLVRDIYIFCCLTSLAFIDVKQLKRSEVTVGIDGKLWIDKKRQKSKVPTKVPLLPITKQILEKYKNHPYCVEKDLLLPVLSNARYNEYLKEIAAICGINKRLTSHTARHTFGTTVTLSNGVPIESVKQMMGHKKMSQTEHYAKILPAKVSEDMQQLEKKLKKKKFLEAYHIGDVK